MSQPNSAWRCSGFVNCFHFANKTQLGISSWTHLAALSVACTIGIITLNLPAKPLQQPVVIPSAEQLTVALPLPKAKEATLFGAEPNLYENAWATATVRPGDNLSGIFNRLGIDADDLYTLMSCCPEAESLAKIKPGEVFKIRTDASGDLTELVFTSKPDNTLRLFRDGRRFKVGDFRHVIEKRPAFISASVRQSFAQDVRKAGLSKRLYAQLKRIVGKRIKLADIRPGDSFTILYEEDFFSGEKISDGAILAIDLTLRSQNNKKLQVVGYRNKNGALRYYTPDGESLRPAFLRYPVRYNKISSRFNLNRRHPILGTRRPHKGVDFAAPRGTPIRAVGDAVVKNIGWQRGYGKTIVLDHGRGYTTLYAHLSGFKSALKAGTRISKGQVIGYVGSTGLSTGNHLHYEFRINNIPKNPLRVSLPGDPPLKGRQRQRFKQQIQPLLAQLDLHRRVRLALSQN